MGNKQDEYPDKLSVARGDEGVPPLRSRLLGSASWWPPVRRSRVAAFLGLQPRVCSDPFIQRTTGGEPTSDVTDVRGMRHDGERLQDGTRAGTGQDSQRRRPGPYAHAGSRRESTNRGAAQVCCAVLRTDLEICTHDGQNAHRTAMPVLDMAHPDPFGHPSRRGVVCMDGGPELLRPQGRAGEVASAVASVA